MLKAKGFLLILSFLWVSSTVAANCDQELRPPPVSQADEWVREFPALPAQYKKSLQLTNDGTHPVLSIVVPAFREEKRIGTSILKMREFFDHYPYPIEILLRIEKSPDATVAAAVTAAAADPRIKIADHGIKRGKGYAVRQGMLRATGDYILFMDADLSTPLPEIFHFLAVIAETNSTTQGPDVVIGDRRHPDSQIESDQSFHRQVMGATFRGIIRSVLSTYGLRGISDTQCGFKLFTRQAAQTLFALSTVDGFAFDIEVLLLAAELGLKVEALPVVWRDDPRSTVHPILDPAKMLWDVIKMRAQVRVKIQSLSPKEIL